MKFLCGSSIFNQNGPKAKEERNKEVYMVQ